MFTGLIQDVGRIKALRRSGRFAVFDVSTKLADEDLQVGDSLSVQGACLTVVSVQSGMVRVEAVAETLARTKLGALSVGERVNLERALRLSDGLDGHIVQGHVDGMGRVLSLQRDGAALLMTIESSPDLLRYVVEKGSVAVDGVSLTVAKLVPNGLVVSLIPHTMSETTLENLRVGDAVNIETDILAKYVERFVGGATTGSSSMSRGINLDRLSRNGFLND